VPSPETSAGPCAVLARGTSPGPRTIGAAMMRAMTAEHFTLTTQGAQLAGRDSGGDGKPWLFVNGGGATQRHWDRVIRALPDGCRIITYDQRGHGASSRSDDYSFPALVGDLEALISKRELVDAMLVGHSLGAGVALVAGERTPTCRGIVALDGALPVSSWPARDRERSERLEASVLVKALLALRRLRHRGFSMSISEIGSMADDYREHVHDFEIALTRLTCPALYVLGTKERGPNGPAVQKARQEAAEVLSHVPTVQVEWVPAGHNMILSIPGQIAEMLIRFDGESGG
jgi:pimeloyl-ACP methyl ester carboxylesterase